MKKSILIGLTLICFASADLYLHSLRGSNNRLNEDVRDRNNANRLFDSQNNERGGYNSGYGNTNDVMTFYGGSKIKIEWTNQHSCGDENNHCEIIIQYMCSENLRDGKSVGNLNPIIPDSLASNTDNKYGMHEDFYHYQHCKHRKRNNLFLGDQKLLALKATNTRQNNAGTRRGFECPEERDYYPYWHYSEWKDIAVLTNDCSRCEMYQRESQNVKDKYYCKVVNYVLGSQLIPITRVECEQFKLHGKQLGVWTKRESFGIDPPVCIKSRWSRDNHHGNTIGGQMASFIWTVPDNVNEDKCALRMRYNISTGDFKRDFPEIETFAGNPIFDVFGLVKLKLQLAINTAQFGRTFQDRSHRFSIKPRPSNVEDDVQITNIQVRGKRGNIVQVYPGVEYDFTPNHAKMEKGSHTHFQWTGSNNNPIDDNPVAEGWQGPDKTDRHNAILLRNITGPGNVHGYLNAIYPSDLEKSSFAGMKDLDSLAKVTGKFYYNNRLQKVTNSGAFNYFCTHNTKFGERSQKATLVVYDEYLQMYIGEDGAVLNLGPTVNITVPEDALRCTTYVEVGVITAENYWPTPPRYWINPPRYTDFISSIIHLWIDEELQEPVTIKIRLTKLNEKKVHVYHSPRGNSSWMEITDVTYSGWFVSFETEWDGTFVVAREPEIASGTGITGIIIGVVIGVLILIAIIVLVIWKFCTCCTYEGLGGYGERI